MDVIVLIACIAGVVWGTWFALRGNLIAGCVLYLVLACCCGPYLTTIEVAGVSLSIDRVFLVGLIAAYVAQRRLGQLEPKPLTRADWVLFAFLSVLALSTVTHDWRDPGPAQVPILQHLINGYLIPLTVFWIARQTPLNQRATSWLLGGLCVFGVYLAITGLLESAEMWSLVFPRYIADPKLGLHFGRARGPMVQSVSYGLYVGACMLAGWLWKDRLPIRWRTLVLAVLPALGAAIFLTKTRTVWLGAASGVAIVVGLTCTGRTRVAILGAMVAGVLLVGVLKSEAILGLQREGTVEDTRRSASMRGSFAYVSWRMFQDRPLFGFGFGQFAREKLPYLSDRSVDLQLEAIRPYVHHNTFLSVLTETGLVGLSLFVTLLATWVAYGWRLARDRNGPVWCRTHGTLFLSVLAVAGWQMIGHEITFTPLDNSLIFLMAGVAVGLRATAIQPGSRRSARQPTNGTLPGVGMAS